MHLSKASLAVALALSVVVSAGCAKEPDSAPAAGGSNGKASNDSKPGSRGGSDGAGDGTGQGKEKGGSGRGGKGEDDGASTRRADEIVTITVRGGRVTGPDEVVLGVGETVALSVTSDRRDEVHIHGYDVSRPVTPGKTAKVTLIADIPGQFEVELEQSQVELLELIVQ